jgi:glucose-1-phosphate thymidylyltransferase
MLEHVLEKLEPIPDVDGIYLVTNSKFAGHFRDWAEQADVDVTVIDDGTADEESRLGAIGDLDLVIREHGLDDDLIAVAGDNLFSDSLEDFGETCRALDAPVLAVYDIGDLAQMYKYSSITVADDGRITYFEEKPEHPTSTLTGIALYFYPRRTLPLIRRYVAEGNNPDQPGRLVQWMYPQMPFYTWRVPGVWYDIGSPETLAEADRIFSE